MKCELLRSCYTATYRPFFDSEETRSIDWCWAKPKAKWLPVPNCLSSANWWTDKEDEPAVGEVSSDGYRWRDGSGVFGAGTHYAGTPAMFQYGASINDPPLAGPPDAPCDCEG